MRGKENKMQVIQKLQRSGNWQRASPGVVEDYRRYGWNKMEFMGYFLLYTGISCGLGWLFYQSIWGILPIAAVVIPIGLRRKNHELLGLQKQQLATEFTDCIRLVSGGLSAGYSMENAWQNAQNDLENMHGKDAAMCRELRILNAGVRVNEPIEKLLQDFAVRSGLEDVDSFCQVLSFAKRSGGNLVKIIGHTVSQISDKREVIREIDTVLSARKLEQKMMNMIPMLLIAYVEISSPDFISALYGNLVGQLIMTGCLLIYGIAFLLSEKIMRIEV